MSNISDGFVIVVKKDCPTCTLIEPVIKQLSDKFELAIFSQDDPAFPNGGEGVTDDTALEQSFKLNIEIVPTLIKFEKGAESERTYGWNRDDWQKLTGLADIGAALPENRPGCGSKTQDPGMAEKLIVKYGETGLKSRPLGIDASNDPMEFCYDQGWTDGLPVVPPTRERVLTMLQGTSRSPQDIVGVIPPDRVECTVEKVAVNAVMAGCKPEYLPVVLAAVEASLDPNYGLHGILCTTNSVAPVIMVNGPIIKAIGMNAKGNALGQGNRANATIGRAFQLVIRNVGGGRPQEIDRSVFGNPGKYSFCFAEDEDDPEWESYAVENGFSEDQSTVTVFSGDGVQPIIDQSARDPETLSRTYAACLKTLYHPGQVVDVAAFLVVSPDHVRVFHQEGWSKQRLRKELDGLLQIPASEVVQGFGQDSYVTDEMRADPTLTVPKFRSGTLNFVRAGGSAGLFTGIISGLGSITINPVIKEIKL